MSIPCMPERENKFVEVETNVRWCKYNGPNDLKAPQMRHVPQPFPRVGPTVNGLVALCDDMCAIAE